jgi:hypothetical protein
LYIQNESKPAHVILVDQDLQHKTFDDMVIRARNTFEKCSHAPEGLPKFEEELLGVSQRLKNALSAQNPSEILDLQITKDKKENLVNKIKSRMQKLKEDANIMDKYLSGEYKGIELNDSS